MGKERDLFSPASSAHEAQLAFSPVPGRQVHAGDSAETGHEGLGALYSGPSVFSSGDVGGDMGESPIEMSEPDGVAELGAGSDSPSELAEQGFAGHAQPLPFRAQLERSFGVPLGGVEAYTDANAQQASERLGAHAYASGNRIAFATASPDIGLVAHELTHVLQHTGSGPAQRSDNAGKNGIETSGEHEAEQVQAAVNAGKPAHSALQGDRGAIGRGKGPGPALHASQKPALSSSPLGIGMSFSPSGFEVSGSYKIWSADKGIELPIPAVPGLSFKVAPSVTASVANGGNFAGNTISKKVGINGSVRAGLAYGYRDVAEIDAGLQASASGSFIYKRTRGGGKSQSKSTHASHDSWSFKGSIGLSSDFVIGVSFAGGLLSRTFSFGHCDIGTVAGLSWTDGKFNKSGVGWTWGATPKKFFATIKDLIKQVKSILGLPVKAAKAAWKALGAASGFVVSGVLDAAGAVSDAAVATAGAVSDAAVATAGAVSDAAGATAGAVAGAAGAVIDGVGGIFTPTVTGSVAPGVLGTPQSTATGG